MDMMEHADFNESYGKEDLANEIMENHENIADEDLSLIENDEIEDLAPSVMDAIEEDSKYDEAFFNEDIDLCEMEENDNDEDYSDDVGMD